jgi:hypothetical protein
VTCVDKEEPLSMGGPMLWQLMIEQEYIASDLFWSNQKFLAVNWMLRAKRSLAIFGTKL